MLEEIFQDQSADGAVTTPLLCPLGLECLLDTSQLVIHTGNFRHDLCKFVDLLCFEIYGK